MTGATRSVRGPLRPAEARWRREALDRTVQGEGRPNSHPCRAGGNLSRTELRDPRHNRTRLSLSTACAGLSAQSPTCGVDVRALLSGTTNHHSQACPELAERVTNHCISNRYKVRIEIAVSHRKQRKATNSNRNSFRGSSKRRDENNWRGGGSARTKRDPSSRNVIRDARNDSNSQVNFPD
jgi:hypothetical protein